MNTIWKNIIPVLPSSNLERDIAWYKEKVGFQVRSKDSGYAILQRETLQLHLQWHADTHEDPLIGGSVIRIFVQYIQPVFEELVSKGTVNKDSLQRKTPWNTNEFGFYDLNKNAIFIVEAVANKN